MIKVTKLMISPYFAVNYSELEVLASVRLGELRYRLEQISFVRSHSFVWKDSVYVRREALLLVVATRIHSPDTSRFWSFYMVVAYNRFYLIFCVIMCLFKII